ncbi:unnamed protein product [Rhizoctonia solani]|uniref:CHAT domain-containing protein n=1 Tax=Rhizoctonia solani TaxID=456999 RepID=A0A8H3HI25_9AGAM|nr:unnamed protein product [Rhizoctonia solani]
MEGLNRFQGGPHTANSAKSESLRHMTITCRDGYTVEINYEDLDESGELGSTAPPEIQLIVDIIEPPGDSSKGQTRRANRLIFVDTDGTLPMIFDESQRGGEAGQTQKDALSLVQGDRRLRVLKAVSQIVRNMAENDLPKPTIDRIKDLDKRLTHEIRITSNLQSAETHENRYGESGGIDNLNAAIGFYEAALALVPLHHPLSAPVSSFFCRLLETRYERLGDLSDLSRAIECLLTTTAMIPDGREMLPLLLLQLARVYYRRFDLLSTPEDLDQLIGCLERAIPLTRGNTEGFSAQLKQLGLSYLLRFERTRGTQDIDKAIKWLERAVATTPAYHEDLPDRLNQLGGAYEARFRQQGTIEDADRAIELKAQGVLQTPDGHPEQSALLNSQGVSYVYRFERFGRTDDIKRAIEFLTQAVARIPDYHPKMPRFLNDLGAAHIKQFEHLGDLVNVEKAVEYQQYAVHLAPAEDEELPTHLGNLGGALLRRFQHCGDIQPSLQMLGNLGGALLRRFQHCGDIQDLHDAIENLTKAVNIAHQGSERLVGYQSNLGAAYLDLFDRLGNVEHADRAIECLTHAITLPSGTTEALEPLNNLGFAYHQIYKRLIRAEYLDRAIQCGTKALNLSHEGHPDLATCLSNLGALFRTRFESGGTLQDLNDAITYQRRALDLIPADHPPQPSFLNNLGTSHLVRFDATGEVDDIITAVNLLERAVDFTPKGHANRPLCLSNLGSALAEQFLALNNPDILDKAIQTQKEAVSAHPPGHPTLPLHLYLLGDRYTTRFRQFGDLEVLFGRINCFKLAAKSPVGPPQIRFIAAHKWGCLTCLGSPTQGLEAFQVAINLIPQIIWLGATINERYNDIHWIGDGVQDAIAAAINFEKYPLALEWLEQGRSVVWNQSLQLWSPLDELSASHPEHSSELKQVTAELYRAGSNSMQLAVTTEPKLASITEQTLEQSARQHRNLAAQYDRLLASVRQLSGFENFLLPKMADHLFHAVQTGPLVIVNAHRFRCDALILHPGSLKITHVSLPDLLKNSTLFPFGAERTPGPIHRRSDLGKPVDQFKTAASDSVDQLTAVFQRLINAKGEKLQPGSASERRPLLTNHTSGQELRDILGMLWTTVAKPILDILQYKPGLPIDELPHITWCTTGLLTFFPIHAAGLYDFDHPDDRMYKYAISSYTPTISALLSANTNPNHEPSGMLAVGQENTPGQSRLSQTLAELDRIKDHVKSGIKYTRLTENSATTKTVLEAMESHDWVHLACHAHQDTADPTSSGFFLHDGVLSIAAINQKAFKNKGVAFLSACQTAMGDKKIADEAIHLASAMLVAGYPSVIATMWSIMDNDGPVVADIVYGHLLKDGKMNHRDAARALHIAVGRLREVVGEEEFVRWVPFIHIGK